MRRRRRPPLHEWVKDRLHYLAERLERLDPCEDDYEIERITREVDRFYNWWQKRHPSAATQITLTVQGGHQMASFSINTTDGSANLQFNNSAGSAVAGPLDSVDGVTPVAPEVVSDTPSVLTVAQSVAGGTDGAWTAALTMVAAGVANISVAALTNSDGSPVLETEGSNAGQPFGLPASIEVTVTADNTPTGLSMTVTG